MRIRIETPDRLVITDRPMVLAVVLSAILLVQVGGTIAIAAVGEWFGVAMMLLGVAMVAGAIAAFVRRTDLILDRLSGEAHLQSSTLLGKRWQSWPLADITGATVQTSRDSDGGSTFRPALLLSGGKATELTPVYSGGLGAERAVAAITRWLADPEAAA